MKKEIFAGLAKSVLSVAILLMLAVPQAEATFLATFDFETNWTGDYAPGWENTGYRHGAAPVAKMMQQSTIAHTGSFGVELIAGDPLGLFWVAVNPTGIPVNYLDKQYDPYLSAWYYERNTYAVAGQIFAVPDSPIADDDDWTDVQFGGRRQPASDDNFNYIAAPSAWVETEKVRTGGWHNLMMQLSSGDGKIHFYLDGVSVGETGRDDYTNLGTVGLYTMFDATSLGTNGGGSSTIWDDVQVGSTVPEPSTMLLLGFGLIGLAGVARKKIKK